MEADSVEPEFLLDPLHLRGRRYVPADAQLATYHVTDEYAQGLAGAACCPDGSGEVNREELGAVGVVHDSNTPDAVERGHQYCFGQDRETDPQAGVDGFRDVSGPRIHPLGHIEGYLDGSGLPVGVPQEVAQVVFYAHPIEIFLEQLLRPAS